MDKPHGAGDPIGREHSAPSCSSCPGHNRRRAASAVKNANR
ncbi:DUF3678 domain-containing protein [Denitromonas halophila]|uniref:DUF3678 domain-containing protein n=1 Tax=Denitromonas halophila TaxID=1629404 RepID=A0A557QH83_9RHOO|nr:DUF3678 domain-containing protein [Denitromonas halophila]